jgi:hypothetical protein
MGDFAVRFKSHGRPRAGNACWARPLVWTEFCESHTTLPETFGIMMGGEKCPMMFVKVISSQLGSGLLELP